MGTNQSARGDEGADFSMEDRELRVVLEITRGGPCVMDDLDGDVVDIDVRFQGGCCNVDAKVRNSEDGGVGTKFFTNQLCHYCPGKVFSKRGCLPRYLHLEEGSFVMETYVSDTGTVAEIVEDVREICEQVTIRSITSTEDSDCQEVRTVDVEEMTPKQRQAVFQAQEAGYYDPSSSVALEEIADRMDVSPSALSQRLQRAEANVLRQLNCACSCWCDD